VVLGFNLIILGVWACIFQLRVITEQAIVLPQQNRHKSTYLLKPPYRNHREGEHQWLPGS
jgi:hypothetical protein